MKAETTNLADADELFGLTNQLKAQYEQLASLIESLHDENGRDVAPMNDQMQRIKQTEATLKPLRDEFLAKGNVVDGPLKKVNDETIEIVISLMPMLAELEKSSVESLRRLFPKIQGSVRAIQMQNAYQHHRHGHQDHNQSAE